jgi:hypothetical protein
MGNLLNEIIAENSSNLEKDIDTYVLEEFRISNSLDQNSTSLYHIIVKDEC